MALGGRVITEPSNYSERGRLSFATLEQHWALGYSAPSFRYKSELVMGDSNTGNDVFDSVGFRGARCTLLTICIPIPAGLRPHGAEGSSRRRQS